MYAWFLSSLKQLRACFHDSWMNIILEWAHFIPVRFLYDCWQNMEWNVAHKQVILKWVHSGSQSQWKSHSGMKFQSLHYVNADRISFRHENHKLWSLALVMCMRKCSTNSKIELKSLNLIIHMNAGRTLIQNKSRSGMNLIPESCEKALISLPAFSKLCVLHRQNSQHVVCNRLPSIKQKFYLDVL